MRIIQFEIFNSFRVFPLLTGQIFFNLILNYLLIPGLDILVDLHITNNSPFQWFFFHSITIHAAEYIDELIIITVILFRFERCSDSICSKRGFPFFRVIRERGHQENIYKLKLKCDPCKLLHPMFVK